MIHNSTTEAVTIDLSTMEGLSFETISGIAGLGSAKLEGNTLTLEGQTSVVLR